MKKTATLVFLILLGLFATPLSTDAQINGLLKKVKKNVEKVLDNSTTETTSANALADVADIKILYASGDTISANYGRVMLIVSVNMKVNKPQIRLGSVNNTAMMAVTPDGKIYKPELNLNGVYPKDVVEGTAVTIPLDDHDMIINNIPLGTTTFQTIKLGVMVDPTHKETLTFSNVPIKWEHNSNTNK